MWSSSERHLHPAFSKRHLHLQHPQRAAPVPYMPVVEHLHLGINTCCTVPHRGLLKAELDKRSGSRSSCDELVKKVQISEDVQASGIASQSDELDEEAQIWEDVQELDNACQSEDDEDMKDTIIVATGQDSGEDSSYNSQYDGQEGGQERGKSGEAKAGSSADNTTFITVVALFAVLLLAVELLAA
ncbi:hypothetical protein QQS21_012648 [Conoideocrella luteorostrata]|uniref:Uncharacterized protein n=1 Tax=Conoideocrella luteorostrata TaxID=1105319 RepID=A0AAJ0CDI2_9HYPO|nr:hypothetical protein QQS21_012648 [Conoideocrella luteorostrata]